MMEVELKGNSKKPLLVCVQGLMGAVSDFEPFVDSWSPYFHIVLPNIADPKQAFDSSYADLDESGEKRLIYEKAPMMIADYLEQEFPGRKAFFAGISLGGKITIEFAGNYPQMFLGAVVTDVGIGPLCNSEFFEFITTVLPSINLQQNWPELRKELNEKIPDRMLRLLIQMHLELPGPEKSFATWKSTSFDFPELVQGTKLEDQWHLLDKIPAPILILKASHLSAISREDYEKMNALGGPFHFEHVPESNHFIQINNGDIFEKAVLNYLSSIKSSQN